MQDLQNAAILVLANKQDIKGSMTAAEISQCLTLDSITTHSWHVQGCCALTGEGWAHTSIWATNTRLLLHPVLKLTLLSPPAVFLPVWTGWNRMSWQTDGPSSGSNFFGKKKNNNKKLSQPPVLKRLHCQYDLVFQCQHLRQSRLTSPALFWCGSLQRAAWILSQPQGKQTPKWFQDYFLNYYYYLSTFILQQLGYIFIFQIRLGFTAPSFFRRMHNNQVKRLTSRYVFMRFHKMVLWNNTFLRDLQCSIGTSYKNAQKSSEKNVSSNVSSKESCGD